MTLLIINVLPWVRNVQKKVFFNVLQNRLHIPLGCSIMSDAAWGSRTRVQLRPTRRGAGFTLTGCAPPLAATFTFLEIACCG